MALKKRSCTVSSNGNLSGTDGGPGTWGSSRSNTGVYTITYPEPAISTGTGQVLLVMPVGGGVALWGRVSGTSQTGTTVTIYNSFGTAVDSAFTFEMYVDFQ